MKKALFVIANNGFQDYEFAVPYDYFIENNIEVTISAEKQWECVGVFGSKTYADKEISEIDPTKYDMLIFIGWWWAYTQYFGNKDYLNLSKKAKKIGAICIAPMILSDSGVFYGKKVTGRDQWNIQKNYIQKNGWSFVEKPVVLCDNIVTADGPESANLFAMKCLDLLLSD